MKQFFRQFFVLLLSSLCILQACKPPNIIGTFDTNKNNSSFNTKADPLCGEQWSVSVPYSDDDTTVTVNGNQVLSVPVRGSGEIVNINSSLNQGSNSIVFTTTNTGYCPSCVPDQYPYGWTYNIYRNGAIYLSDSGGGRDGNNTTYTKNFSINANIQACPTPTPTPIQTPYPTPTPTLVDIPIPPTSCPAPEGFSTKAGLGPIIDFLVTAYDLYVELDKLAKENPQVFDTALAEMKSAYNAAYNLVCGSDPKAQDKATKDLKKAMDNAQKVIDKSKITVGSYPNGVYEASPKHGIKDTPFASRSPKDGQEALDNSILVKNTSPTRIGISEKEIVVLQETTKGIYHGYVVPSNKLTTEQFNALYKEGLINLKGKIL